MKKPAIYSASIILIISYLWILIARRLNFPLPEFFSSYWGDLLCLPILMFSSLIFIRWVKRRPRLEFTAWHILFVLIYVSIIFEWILPTYSQQYTSDPWDVVCYAFGAMAFWLLQPLMRARAITQRA